MNKSNIKGVHALLVTPEGKVILQKKTSDYVPNPDAISMFGGGVEAGEDQLSSLRRELEEELNLNIDTEKFENLGVYYKTKKVDGVEHGVSVYILRDINMEELKLAEGERLVVDHPLNIIEDKHLTRITKLALKDFLNK